MDKMDFRFDIAFLRGMAIIAVVLYHLHLQYFKNGYLGVDIFFVISGYQFFNLLLSDIPNGMIRRMSSF